MPITPATDTTGTQAFNAAYRGVLFAILAGVLSFGTCAVLGMRKSCISTNKEWVAFFASAVAGVMFASLLSGEGYIRHGTFP